MSAFLYFQIEGALSPTQRVPYEGDLVLGGHPDCGLVLPHGSVAARHARLTGPHDRLLLSSLGAPTSVRRAGTVFVVRVGIPFPLLAGDQLALGEVRLQLLPAPQAEAAARGGTRLAAREAVERRPREVPVPDPWDDEPPAAAPAGRRPRGVTRVVDTRGEAPVGRRPEGRAEPSIPARTAENRAETRAEVRQSRVPPRGHPRWPPSSPADPARLRRRPQPRPAGPQPRPSGPVPRPRELTPRGREVPPEPAPDPARRASLALRSQPAAARTDDPLEDGPTAFFSRQAVRAPTEVPRTKDEKPASVAPAAVPVLTARERLEHEVATLEAAVEGRAGAQQVQRRRGEQRAALEAALLAQQRPLQDAERALLEARRELAGHEHTLAAEERRCRELETEVATLRSRRETAEARRDESVRRLREAEQVRDTTWQAVWSLEHDQLRLEGLIDNLELALGLAPKRG